VPCPDELVAITQLKRTDEPSAAVDEASQLTASSHATRMMDCCKPSAGFVGNVPNFDQDYPLFCPARPMASLVWMALSLPTLVVLRL